MIYEDEYGEESVENGDFDIAIPFRLSLKNGGEPEITVFPSLRETAVEFIKNFKTADEIFKSETIEWVRRRVAPFCFDRIFVLSDTGTEHFINYRLKSTNSSFIQNSTRRIDDLRGLENLTSYDIEAMIEFGHICFGTVIDGKILSVVCTNYPFDPEDEENEFEIGVETAEAVRGKGYALSNCAAVAKFLKENGRDVLYECEDSNIPSRKLIERLGGEEFARNFCVVAERVEKTI